MPGEDQPLLQPRLVRLLKRRPKLVAENARNEMLEEIEINMMERRLPGRVAERTVERTLSEMKNATSKVAQGRAKQRMAKANQGTLRRL